MYMDDNLAFVNNKAHQSTAYSKERPRFTDPGPAGDYVDQVAAGGGFKPGPIARSIKIDLRDPYSGAEYSEITRERCDADVLEFYEVVRSQGDEKVRHQALTRRLSEARADPNLSASAYRLLAQIASNAHGDYRYSFQSHEALAAACGMGSATNLSRTMGELIRGGYVARLVLSRSRGGWPVPVYAVRCCSEVRSGASWVRLCDAIAQAVAERRAAKGVKEPPATRSFDEMQFVEPTTWLQNQPVNSSKLRESIRQNDDPNRESSTCSTIDVEVVDRGCASPSAQPPDEQPSLAGESWPEVEVEAVESPRDFSEAASRKPPKRRADRSTKIDETAQLDQPGIEYAIGKCWTIERALDEFEGFKIHHLKKGSKFERWDMAWQGWVRKGIQIDAERLSRPGGRPKKSDVSDWSNVRPAGMEV